ncbi:hypothetical protein HDR58_10405 [bacterium]|nr:hypothetical protein [bacterium]
MNQLENNILTAYINKVKNELEHKNIYNERNIGEDKKLSFAFVVYTLERFLDNYNIDEIIDDITEGSADNSIDIFNIDTDENEVTINLFQCKYKSDKKLDSTIGENEVLQFITKIKEIIIDNQLSDKTINPYLTKKLDEYKDIIKGVPISNIKVNLYLVTNGNDINSQEQNKLKTFKNEYPIISNIDVLNSYSFFVEPTRKNTKEFELKITDEIIKMNNNINSCIVSFKAYELVRLYEEFSDSILEKNVRKLLGGKINQSIAESLQKDPKMFWYKNNGLSIVCKRWESKKIDGFNALSIEDPYIVNGGQTTKTIYNLYQKCKTDEEKSPFYDAYVMARIYQTTDENEISAIVQGTNNQNKIITFDLKSTNKNLKKLKKFFELNNISLLIDRNIEEEKLEKAINSESLLQLYCASYMEIPHRSKISKAKLTENYYDNVYNNEEAYNDLLNIYKIYEFVKEKNKTQKQSHITHSLYSILYLIFKLEPSLKTTWDIKILEPAYNKAIEIIDEIVKEQAENNPDYSNHNFFKSELSTITIKSTLNNKVLIRS